MSMQSCKLGALAGVVLVGLNACGSDTVVENTADAKAVPSVEIIASGANIAGANGMALGPDGNLYVASVLGSNISVLDTESGDVLKVYGPEEGVIGPDDVAFGPDGSWYWTSIMTGEVAGFNPQGEKVVAAQLTAGGNPITFADDGRLFV